MNPFTFPFTFDGHIYTASCRPTAGEEGKIHYYIDLPGGELTKRHGSPIRITRTKDGIESYPDSTPTGHDDGRRLVTSIYEGFTAFRNTYPGIG